MGANTMLPAGALTDRQREVLQYVWDHLLEHGYQPSFRDIMRRFGMRSTNAINGHLRFMAGKGFIALGKGDSRAIRFLKTPDGKPFVGLDPKGVA